MDDPKDYKNHVQKYHFLSTDAYCAFYWRGFRTRVERFSVGLPEMSRVMILPINEADDDEYFGFTGKEAEKNFIGLDIEYCTNMITMLLQNRRSCVNTNDQ